LIVLDTNVVSELLRSVPDPAVLRWAEGFAREDLVTTAVTEAELRYGIAVMPLGARRTRLATSLDAIWLDWLGRQVLSFEGRSASPFATFAALRRQTGRPVGVADAMIAAIALANGARAIATRDLGDFDGCGVALVNPWDA
jgi:toxin FitB